MLGMTPKFLMNIVIAKNNIQYVEPKPEKKQLSKEDYKKYYLPKELKNHEWDYKKVLAKRKAEIAKRKAKKNE